MIKKPFQKGSCKQRMKTEHLIVPQGPTQPLQDFLVLQMRLSRNATKRLLDTRNVFVNTRRVWMAKHLLKPGDKVEVVMPTQTEPAREAKISILFEDEDYLIIDKPAGVLSNGAGSAEEQLRGQRKNPAILAAHRLDRDTSGCLLMAKSQEAFEKIIPVFRDQSITKTYHAIIVGRLDTPAQTVTFPIDGESAVTNLRTLSATADASHLEVTIETGRTHQIRKHLSAIKHPIAGDHQYGTRHETSPKLRTILRQMLHATALVMRNPLKHTPIRAKAPLPADFLQTLRTFKLS
jgi:23S rRNA pseudouridine1911/1915/1917 synthase